MMVKLKNILGIRFSKNDFHKRISKRITTKTACFRLVSENEIHGQFVGK